MFVADDRVKQKFRVERNELFDFEKACTVMIDDIFFVVRRKLLVR